MARNGGTMNRRKAFIFSGQGSQYFQMGRGLYEQNRVFKSWMDRMDVQVKDTLGASVVQALYGQHGKGDPFDDIRLTQPAIFMVEYALAQTVIESGVEPSCTLGASLGTLAALAVAGRISIEDSLSLVVRQAIVIHESCPRGGMLVVFAAPEIYENAPFLQARSVIAGQNFATHFVISAPEANLPSIEAYLNRAGITNQRLPVLYPFHAPWIDPVREKMIDAMDGLCVRDSSVSVVCCALEQTVQEVSAEYFWMVMREEIAFMRTVAWMEEQGPFDYVDLGPSGTLATFLKYLLDEKSGSRIHSVMTPYTRDSEQLRRVMGQIKTKYHQVAVGM